MKKEIFLIDGSALFYRSHFAYIRNPLITSTGINVSAVYGFTKTIMDMIKSKTIDYIAVMFDPKGGSFRHEMYKEYKATRDKMPDEMIDQFPSILEILKGFNVPVFIEENYEADDLIGSYARALKEKGFSVIIYTADKDFLQLLEEDIMIFNYKKQELLDVQWLMDNEELKPDQIIDKMALEGDKSDNIPGVRGIGKVTAKKLLKKYKSVEDIYNHLETVKPESVKSKLKDCRDDAFLSKELVTIKTDIDVQIEEDKLKIGDWDTDKLREVFRTFEFKSFIEEIGGLSEESSNSSENLKEYEIVKYNKDKILKLSGNIFVDLVEDREKTEFLNILNDDKLYSVKINDNEKLKIDFSGSDVVIFSHYKKSLRLIEGIDKIARNKFFPLALAAYIVNPTLTNYEIPNLAAEHLHKQVKDEETLLGKGQKRRKYEELDSEELNNYFTVRLNAVENLYPVLDKQLETDEMRKLFYELEIPLTVLLNKIEDNGVFVSEDKLAELKEDFKEYLDDLTKKIQDLAGIEFNIRSVKQLSEVLFDKLELPVIKKTKTGYSTDNSVLEKLSEKGYKIADLLLEYRTYDKLLSTYINSFGEYIDEKTHRIHTTFKQIGIATGRLSSTNPNLQNLPIKTEVGKKIRKLITAPNSDTLILSADYSQIELRILAHYSGDESLIESFKNNEDVHSKTASRIFKKDMAEISREERMIAKTINFGVMYGMGFFKLSNELNITRKQAQKFIKQYFEIYSGVKNFTEEQKEKAKNQGYVETLFGRKRYIPEFNSKVYQLRQFAERVAVNSPIQGTAADIIKFAMLRIDNELRKRDFRAKMILQIHDELLFEVHKDDVEEFKKFIISEMENAAELKVPLKVDAGVGPDWLDAH